MPFIAGVILLIATITRLQLRKCIKIDSDFIETIRKFILSN